MAQRSYEWYAQLKKPFFAPPSWLFGVVWTFLYIIIAGTFGFVFIKAFKGEIPAFVAIPFVLNLFFNVIFTPIQFRLKNNYLALLDVLLVVGTLVWALVAVYPYARVVSYANIPYVLWGSFASVLQACVTWLNNDRV